MDKIMGIGKHPVDHSLKAIMKWEVIPEKVRRIRNPCGAPIDPPHRQG
jgi:hypothetical protein